MILGLIGTWIKEGVERGDDRHVLEQVAVNEAQGCIAAMIRAAKERRGEPFIPARQAIVAFNAAHAVAAVDDFSCDLDRIAEAFAVITAAAAKPDPDDEAAQRTPEVTA